MSERQGPRILWCSYFTKNVGRSLHHTHGELRELERILFLAKYFKERIKYVYTNTHTHVYVYKHEEHGVKQWTPMCPATVLYMLIKK